MKNRPSHRPDLPFSATCCANNTKWRAPWCLRTISTGLHV